MFSLRTRGRLMVSSILLLILALFITTGCNSKQPGSKLKVVTGTSLLMTAVQEVGGDRVEVKNIIPPASCPGHFDIKPSDVAMLGQARVFLMHDWQGQLFTQELVASVKNPKLEVVPVAIKGNWMAPPVWQQALQTVAGILGEKDPANKEYYQTNAQKAIDQAAKAGQEMQGRLQAAGSGKVKVLCSNQQEGFVRWAGLQVVDTYGRPEELTPQKVKELVDKGRQAGVKLIIDNLQSGPDAGTGIAKELGVPQVTLSNFPGGLPGTDEWEPAVRKNVDLLLMSFPK
ncbi:manganese ABC transporter substrate-binding lipoprotein precursor [Moorella thermoacetica]|uniref:Manganese ABC transporter substrate-binding lipoprotein n=1 Tax=Neomoorella thermoacetica TaxID=1525 RepID=A0A1J5JRG7_NEOTH|nr:metal ABC transporter substrate-binding protein [Moorella thermoacetica]OIQ08048.1 manganese ABC transporter substrate-binding lipoprotein precursor [Moorella thermoacetica]